MILHTGGLAVGATSTRSSSRLCALRKASDNFMTPSCSPVDPMITRTSRARIRPFTRTCSCRIQTPFSETRVLRIAVVSFSQSRHRLETTAEHSTSMQLRRPHRGARNSASRGKVVATMEQSQGDSIQQGLRRNERREQRRRQRRQSSNPRWQQSVPTLSHPKRLRDHQFQYQSER